MRPIDIPPAEHFTHGTRSRYVCGCRCAPCTGANRARYHQRQAEISAAAGDVVPSGPPGARTIMRAGVAYQVTTCPGANGRDCVAGGAWLRNGGPVCARCLERATVWDGLVDAEPARVHLMKLRRAGIGWKSVAAASDVGHSVLSRILAKRQTRILASTERRILAVDAGARADHAVLSASSAAKVARQVDELRGLGFTRTEIARLLGSHSLSLQIGRTGRVLAVTAAAVARLLRRAQAGDVKPSGPLEDGASTTALLEDLKLRGLTARDLSRLLGFTVNFSQRPAKVFRENAERVRSFAAQLERRRVEGEGLPEGWQTEGRELEQAFGLDGEGRPDGWQWERRTSKKKAKAEEQELRALAREVA